MTNRTWVSSDEFVIDGVRFQVGGFGSIRPSKPGHFFVMKPREMLEPYLDLLDRESPRHIVELGIYFGGSTALLALRKETARLTAFEKSTRPVAALSHLLDTRHLHDRVKVYYGVDQGDVGRLTEIVCQDFGEDRSLDCVIDDASHELDLTRKSFEILFPRIREGGIYIIEDWGWGHFPFSRERAGPSLARLVVEIMLSVPYVQGLVEDVTINRYYAVVRRGSLDVTSVRLEDCVSRRGHRLLAGADD